MGDIMKMSSKSVTGAGDAGDASVTTSVGGDGGVDLYLSVLLVLAAVVIPGEVAVDFQMRFDRRHI